MNWATAKERHQADAPEQTTRRAGVWDRIIEDGKHTGALPGRVLRNSHYHARAA